MPWFCTGFGQSEGAIGQLHHACVYLSVYRWSDTQSGATIMQFAKSPYLVLSGLILAPLFWGGNFVVGSAIANDLPGLWTNFIRWSIALIVLTPFCLKPAWKHRLTLFQFWRELTVMAFLGVVLFNSILYIGLQSASISAAAVAFAVTPFIIAGLVAIIRREPPSARFLFAAVIALAGMIIAQWKSLQAGTDLIGLALVLLSALVWSGYCVAIKHCKARAPAHAIFFAQVLIGNVLLMPALALSRRPEFGELDGLDWIGLVYLGVFAAAIAFWLWHGAVRTAGPTKASVFMNLVPLSAIAFGGLLLQNCITWAEAVAFGLVFLGIALSSLAHPSPNKSPSLETLSNKTA